MKQTQEQILNRFFNVLNDPKKYPMQDTLAKAAIKAKRALNKLRKA